MTSFEFFRGRCEHTKYFYFQVVLKDYTLLLLENDLPKLLSIDESDMLYFVAVWQTFKIDKNGKVKSSDGGFRKIGSDSIDTGNSDDDFKFAPYTTYCYKKFYRSFLGLHIPYNLYEKIDTKILEAFIPELFDNYIAQNSSKKFQKEWNEAITHWEGWKYERSLFLGLSHEDKTLYEEVEKIIHRFDEDMVRETESSGKYSWFSIVWNSVQIVRNGEDENDLIKHLSKISRHYNDEYKEQRKRYENIRREAAKEIVKLIRES